jgi:hypothetical protein
MYASWRSCGLAISLRVQDKLLLDSGNDAIASAEREVLTKIFFGVMRRKYERSEKLEDAFLESGWRISTVPSLKKRHSLIDAGVMGNATYAREYHIKISPELWAKLQRTGYIVTRSIWDRMDVTYWAPGMNL